MVQMKTKTTKFILIQVYAPTVEKDEEKLYEKINSMLKITNNTDITTIILFLFFLTTAFL